MSAPERDRAPLIVTAELPGALQAWAEALRRAHYPAERNQATAHVTLFHALPPSAESELRGALARMAAEHAPPEARLEGVMRWERGTALRLSSPALLMLRAELAERFHGMLSAQDAAPPRLHLTIQNKVTAREAQALQARLAAEIEPRAFAFAGLALHAYRGGPWERLQRWAFRGKRA